MMDEEKCVFCGTEEMEEPFHSVVFSVACLPCKREAMEGVHFRILKHLSLSGPLSYRELRDDYLDHQTVQDVAIAVSSLKHDDFIRERDGKCEITATGMEILE